MAENRPANGQVPDITLTSRTQKGIGVTLTLRAENHRLALTIGRNEAITSEGLIAFQHRADRRAYN